MRAVRKADSKAGWKAERLVGPRAGTRVATMADSLEHLMVALTAAMRAENLAAPWAGWMVGSTVVQLAGLRAGSKVARSAGH